MDPAILAQRTALNDRRMATLAETLAQRLDIPVPLNLVRPTVKDPAVARLYQREALAEFIETVAAHPRMQALAEQPSTTEDPAPPSKPPARTPRTKASAEEDLPVVTVPGF